MATAPRWQTAVAAGVLLVYVELLLIKLQLLLVKLVRFHTIGGHKRNLLWSTCCFMLGVPPHLTTITMGLPPTHLIPRVDQAHKSRCNALSSAHCNHYLVRPVEWDSMVLLAVSSNCLAKLWSAHKTGVLVAGRVKGV